MAQEQLFWILAGLTERSCETGTHRNYRSAIRTFSQGGISEPIIDQLQSGANGNLASKIELLYPASGPFRPNRARASVLPTAYKNKPGIYKSHCNQVAMRPDIWFGLSGSETISEVKVLHDGTIPEFYGHKDEHGVADDADKLRRIRLEPFNGHLLQVVFFLQLPKYSYCSGHSYGKWHDYRESALTFRGIDAQYRQLQRSLKQEPAWPREGAKIVPLCLPDKSTCSCIEKWMAHVFQPDNSLWTFIAADHLADAAIGCAIWEY